MSGEISKTYDPASIESEIYRMWMEEGCFTADPAAPGDPYCIVMPPPNVTGALHLGHAINNTLQDLLVRVHRMRGFNTLWVPGIDHAGIATQAVVEKQLKEKEGLDRHQVGREGLVERIWKWKEQFGNRILEQLKRLGCSCDWTREHFTLDDQCARAVRETFFKLFKDGLIYRGKRLVNWDVHLQTSVSDDEIYHETVKTSLWHVRYPIVDSPSPSPSTLGEGGGEGLAFAFKDPHPNPLPEYQERAAEGRPAYVTVATTRPETMLGDTAVAVHSQDPRWNWAIGKFVELPLTGRRIPIIADDILVDPKFGTGVVKVTPAHDPNDYAVWQRHQGKIEILNILTPQGTINENGGKYAGMKRDAARKKVVEDLTELGLLEKEEPYETQVGHSDRSKTPIEPYLSDQWFVKMAPLAEPALMVVREGIIKFFPERHAQQYLSWLGEKRDWPISRQLWWGHRIQIWRRKDLAWDVEKVGRKLKEWEMHERILFAPIGDPQAGKSGSEDELNTDDWKTQMICVRQPDRDDKPIVEFLEQNGFEQDPDVLDTWFSSALWPHSTLGWPNETPDLQKWYPTSALLTAREIVTLWVARMVMMGMYNMGGDSRLAASLATRAESRASQATRLNGKELGIPFHHVVINTTILDGKGERMSKSKGNGVDPVDIIEAHGADALRFTLTSMATETQDVRLPVKKDAQGRNTSDKFDLGGRFCNKVWQVAHFFVIANLEKIAPQTADKSKWSLADRWIVSRFNRAVTDANAALKHYRFDQYAKVCYDFFYGYFCDWYVEASKPALKDPATAGQTASILAAVLDGSLRLMHPIIPFITESIWSRLNEVRSDRTLEHRLECPPSMRLVLARWPNIGEFDEQAEVDYMSILNTVTVIRNVREYYKAALKVPLKVFLLPQSFRETIYENAKVIKFLTNADLSEEEIIVDPDNDNIEIHGAIAMRISGLADPGAEQNRVAKRRDELQHQIATLQARLANESYTAKAPPHLVKQTRDQLADAQAELAKLA